MIILFAAFGGSFVGPAVLAQDPAVRAADPWAVFFSGGEFEGILRFADQRPDLNPNLPPFLLASSSSGSPVKVISSPSNEIITIIVRGRAGGENHQPDLEKAQLVLLGDAQDGLFRQNPHQPLFPYAIDAQVLAARKVRLSDWLKDSESARDLPVKPGLIRHYYTLFCQAVVKCENWQRELAAQMALQEKDDPLHSSAWDPECNFNIDEWGWLGRHMVAAREKYLIDHTVYLEALSNRPSLIFEYEHDIGVKAELEPGDILEDDVLLSIGRSVAFRLYTWQQVCPPCTGNEPVEIGTLTVYLAEQ